VSTISVGTGVHTGRSLAVQLVDLRRAFGPVKALDGLSIDIAPGELVALLGPSGCGKTTALRALAGLQDLDSGRIIVDGKEITYTRTNRRDMGMVFQAYSLFPHMTARENVAYGLKMRTRKRSSAERTKRATDLLELVGLGSHADHYPHQMSGGQQQRVALARALAVEPTVLLLDEPLSALDAKVRSQLRDEIRRIQLEVGTTTLFVTHDQEEALGIADRVGVMKSGVLEQIAGPAELYERPVTAFVAEFVGLTNPLPCTVSGGQVSVLGTSVPVLPGSVDSGSALALIRPESLTVSLDDAGNGQVVTAGYLGSLCRVHVNLDSGAKVVAQMPSKDATNLGPGARVNVGVKPHPVFAKAAG
jgi:putative spermidine/putrescine transport system ATP-binding protein